MPEQSQDLQKLLVELWEAHQRLSNHLDQLEQQILASFQESEEFAKDMMEHIEEMSLGGQWYNPFDMGPQSQIGKKS